MAGKIDTIKNAQKRLAPLLDAARDRIDKLMSQIQTLPLETRETLERILNAQKERLSSAKNKLEEIDLNKKKINTYVAAKETPRLIEELKVIQDSLKKIDQTVQRLPANASPNKPAPIDNLRSQIHTEPHISTLSTRYAIPDTFEELDPEVFENISDITLSENAQKNIETKNLQNRIAPLIKAEEIRTDKLMSQIQTLSINKETFIKELHDKKKELLELSEKLAQINVTEKKVDSNVAAKGTSFIIQKLTAIHKFIDSVNEKIQKFLNLKKYTTPVTFKELDPEIFEDPPSTKTIPPVSAAQTPTAFNWPVAPSTPIVQLTKNTTQVMHETNRDRNNDQKNQLLMQKGRIFYNKNRVLQIVINKR